MPRRRHSKGKENEHTGFELPEFVNKTTVMAAIGLVTVATLVWLNVMHDQTSKSPILEPSPTYPAKIDLADAPAEIRRPIEEAIQAYAKAYGCNIPIEHSLVWQSSVTPSPDGAGNTIIDARSHPGVIEYLLPAFSQGSNPKTVAAHEE